MEIFDTIEELPWPFRILIYVHIFVFVWIAILANAEIIISIISAIIIKTFRFTANCIIYPFRRTIFFWQQRRERKELDMEVKKIMTGLQAEVNNHLKVQDTINRLARLADRGSGAACYVTVHVPLGRMQSIDSPMIFKGLAWRGGLPSDGVCDSLGTWNPKTNLT